MTEPITLNLTLKELQQIDKYIEYHDYDCDKPLLEKIRNAYPQQKTIRDVINRWWLDTFTSKNKWDVDTCIDDLADQIEFFYMRNKK